MRFEAIMATAVLEIDLESQPTDINGLDAYSSALVLVRLSGEPVGQIRLPVHGGLIEHQHLSQALIDHSGAAIYTRWAGQFLGWREERTDKSVSPTATVAVCTRDRPDDLHRCLESLMRLSHEDNEYLVVDSFSATDETRRVVEAFPQVRYLRENRPGLDIARNRALREARSEVVAFLDDDAVADRNWLAELLRDFNDPWVLCVTGLTMPLELETEAQEWFETYSPFNRGFRRRVFHRSNHDPAAAGRVGAGANMALRRNVLNLVGEFDELLDAGTPTRSGGDTEMFARILNRDYRIVYEPAALAWHCHRRSWKELREVIYGYGVGVYAYWTRQLVVEGNWRVVKHAIGWLSDQQVPNLLRSLLHRSGSVPLDLLLAELRGCAAGPRAYVSSRSRSVKQHDKKEPQRAVQPSSYDLTTSLKDIEHRTVSIIIPTHNRKAILKRSLDALSRQLFELANVEVVVVADRCTDGTTEFLHKFSAPFALQVIEADGQGPAAARNQGAACAFGRLLIFLDDDIEVAPHFIEAHVRAHDGARDSVVIGYFSTQVQGRNDYFNDRLIYWWDKMFAGMRNPGHQFSYTDLLSGNFSLDAELFARVGGFETSLVCQEDYELGVRLLRAGAQFKFAPKAGGKHHETTDLKRSLERKYEEGLAAVQIGERYTELKPSLLLLKLVSHAPRQMFLLRILIFRFPGLGHVFAHSLTSTLAFLELIHWRWAWQRLLDLPYGYWYVRGVADALKSERAYMTFINSSDASPEAGRGSPEPGAFL